MDLNPLRQDLAELEARLLHRTADEPPPNLRDRVLRAVESVSTNHRPIAANWNSEWWSAVAAAILIVLNLSMVVASRSGFSIHSPRDADQVAKELRSLRLAEAQLQGTLK